MFNTSQLSSAPVRSLGIVAGLVPLIGIFSMSAIYPTDEKEASNVIGRPSSWVFVTAWITIVLILLFNSILASFRLDTGSLIAISLATILIGIISMIWLYENHDNADKSISNQIVASLVFATLLNFAIAINAKCDQDTDNVRLVLGSLATIPIGWSFTATLLAFVSSNK